MKSGRQQLIEWMKHQGLTQQETAARFGWDPTFISQLKQGWRLPGLANAVKIQRKTGIPVEAWVSRERDKSLASERA